MIKTYKYKLYNTDKGRYLNTDLDISREIYNYCITIHRRYFKLFNKFLNANKLKKFLTKKKKDGKFSHWNQLNSQSIQDIVERIDKSYKLFFRNLKKGVKCSRPHYKKRDKYNSITFKQCGYKFLEVNSIKINGRKYKYWKSRDFEGEIKTFTVKRKNNGFFIYAVVDVENRVNRIKTGNRAGLDFGLKTFLTLSDGTSIENPRFYKQYLPKLKKISQEFSLSKSKSNTKKKKLTKLHNKIFNCRKDFFFKVALELVEKYDTICVEDLNMKSMQQHKRWGQKVSDLALTTFYNILQNKCEEYNVEFVKVPRFFASSQICHICKTKRENKLTLLDRNWICNTCGSNLDRDLNAANNILEEGTSSSKPKCKPVEKSFASSRTSESQRL